MHKKFTHGAVDRNPWKKYGKIYLQVAMVRFDSLDFVGLIRVYKNMNNLN